MLRLLLAVSGVLALLSTGEPDMNGMSLVDSNRRQWRDVLLSVVCLSRISPARKGEYTRCHHMSAVLLYSLSAMWLLPQALGIHEYAC